jgi:hypothetical protein
MQFRNSVFDVCKKLQTSSLKDEICPLITNLNCYQEGQEELNRSTFGYYGRQLNNQFYGYLFIDEKKDGIANLKTCVSLSEEEKLLLWQGHKVMMDFIDYCLEDINQLAPNVAKNINPYSRYKPIQQVTVANKIDTHLLKQCANEFKNMSIYKKLLKSPMWQTIIKMPYEQLEQLIGILDREILRSPLDIVPNGIIKFKYRMMQGSMNPQDILMVDSCIMLSLREILTNACQLMYSALVGGDLVVLNNDNLISIDEQKSDAIYSYITALVQGIIINKNTELVGDIVLIDCEMENGYKIHEFGRVQQTTMSINRQNGDTTKLTFCIIDDMLNPIANLVKL